MRLSFHISEACRPFLHQAQECVCLSLIAHPASGLASELASRPLKRAEDWCLNRGQEYCARTSRAAGESMEFDAPGWSHRQKRCARRAMFLSALEGAAPVSRPIHSIEQI